METFLQKSADYIYRKYAEEISSLCIIMPTRRASIFFKNALAQAAPSGLWSPQISSMEDFICQLAEVDVLEPIHLQLTLFDIMQQFDPLLEFDKFVGWGGTLLDDFSRMDQNLADTANLFEYLTEAKALERWDPKRAGSNLTPVVDNYFKLWANLERTYQALRKKLAKDKEAYTGMAYRMVAENIGTLLKKSTCSQFIFIGLNALSRSEEKIIRYLLSQNRAEVLFDSDEFYMDAASQNRAGHFLKRYRNNWNLTDWKWSQNNLLTDTKDITVIGTANASMQGRVAGQLLQQIRAENPKAPVAIVLPDETLLLPVLHAIGEEITEYNVTMGLTFKGTPLYNLIDLLFDLHLTGVIQPTDSGYKVYKYHHLTVIKLLNHPFIRRYEQYINQKVNNPYPKDFIRKIVARIVVENRVLLSARELIEMSQEQPLFVALFKTWKNCDDIIAAMYDLIDMLKEVYSHRQDNPVETEYLYIFYTIIKRLDSIFDCREQRLSVRSFKKFLYDQIGNTRLPFSGEPIADIQVMGMLETRALDFENLIILSVNENILPQPKKHHSLMPYDVLKAFGLPTYAEQESITSYHFYRLLQRAKKVNLVYVLPSDTYGSGEKSRFILQLENLLVPANPNITFRDLTAVVEEQEQRNYEPDIIIQKDEQTLQKLKDSLKKGLYPSNLNMYINCSLQYYFNKVAGLQACDEIEEQLGADQFGNIVHKVLEVLFKKFEGTSILVQPADIELMLKLLPETFRTVFAQEAPAAQTNKGVNALLYKVALQVLEKYLKLQLEIKEPIQILSLEQTLATDLLIQLEHENIPVRIAGKADRIDRTENAVRVIDYKTGKVERHDLRIKPENLESHFLTDRKYDKVRQLWLYRYILVKKRQQNEPILKGHENADLQAGIISFRNLNEGVLTAPVSFSEGPETPEENFIATSEKLLTEFIRQMLDPAEPIRKTNDLEVCQYCIYKGICAR